MRAAKRTTGRLVVIHFNSRILDLAVRVRFLETLTGARAGWMMRHGEAR